MLEPPSYSWTCKQCQNENSSSTQTCCKCGILNAWKTNKESPSQWFSGIDGVWSKIKFTFAYEVDIPIKYQGSAGLQGMAKLNGQSVCRWAIRWWLLCNYKTPLDCLVPGWYQKLAHIKQNRRLLGKRRNYRRNSIFFLLDIRKIYIQNATANDMLFLIIVFKWWIAFHKYELKMNMTFWIESETIV